MNLMKKYIAILLLLLSVQCVSARQDSISFSLFMIGNMGSYSPHNPRQVNLIQRVLNYRKNPKGLLFLGNNIDPSLHAILTGDFDQLSSPDRFNFLNDFNGPISIIPGRSDWALGTSEGKEMIKWENKTFNKLFSNKTIYMPDGACPGPVEVPLTDSVTLILLDTQWFLHPYATRMGKCDLKDEQDVWTNLRDLLRLNQTKNVIVAGYYPVKSYGEYGGHFPLWKKVVTFPVVLYREFLGTRQDLSHPAYKEFSDQLQSVLNNFPNVTYVSSHAQNFQYFNKNKVHYIIGGSMKGGQYVDSSKTICSSLEAGFTRLDFYRSGKVELEFFPISDPGHALFQQILYRQYPGRKEPSFSTAPQFPDSIRQAASLQYRATPSKEKWMGVNYRKVWSTRVKVPVFRLTKEKGGLHVVKRGGGQQTHSLRLEAANGHQYNLRSLEKYVEGALPSTVKNTFAVKIVQDNISASNPYAALPVTRLEAFAGIMHTNPKIVYVPRDPAFKQYLPDVAGHLFLFEERPDDDWSGLASFGYSSNIISTDDVLDNITNHARYQVDQQAVVKARLFDIMINDWDRHDDQWRWASFRGKGKTVYRPIPRDRDQAFYVNDGILPWIAARKWLLPKLQGFRPLTKNMNGLAFNARYFDRTFLTKPDWQVWKAMTDSLQHELTDQKIDQAMKAFPAAVRPLCADQTATILKQRRDHLEIMARQLYLSLARDVTIIGTDDKDLFRIQRLNSQQTEVSVYQLSNHHKIENRYYHRIFNTDETKEIRLYGLKDDDIFELRGNTPKGIKIRIIGGKGQDSIRIHSIVQQEGKHSFIYDRKKHTTIQAGKDTKIHLSKYKLINRYNRNSFHYNVVKPGAYMGYDKDDGVFIGGGPVFEKYRFRRQNTTAIRANYAALTGAFNIRYNFDSRSTSVGPDHHISAGLNAPDYALNYFGMGNNSHFDQKNHDEYYYRMRINQFFLNYAIGYHWGKTAHQPHKDRSVDESSLNVGPFLKRSNIENDPNRFITNLSVNGLSKADLQNLLTTGIVASYQYVNLDRQPNPQRGFSLQLEGRQAYEINPAKIHFSQLKGDLKAYLSFTKAPRTVLAFRMGGSSTFGQYPFTEAAQLGGKTNLRGYLANRFYGDQSMYQNTEIRYKLLNFSSYVLNAGTGLIGFYDSGRVWLKQEDSDKWHHGFGAGFWISPFNMAIFTATYNWSQEDRMFQLNLNFMF